MKDERQEFADYVNANYKEQRDSAWPLIQAFRIENIEDDMEYAYHMGWEMAIQWMGELLGIELALPPKEERDKIDELFKSIEL